MATAGKNTTGGASGGGTNAGGDPRSAMDYRNGMDIESDNAGNAANGITLTPRQMDSWYPLPGSASSSPAAQAQPSAPVNPVAVDQELGGGSSPTDTRDYGGSSPSDGQVDNPLSGQALRAAQKRYADEARALGLARQQKADAEIEALNARNLGSTAFDSRQPPSNRALLNAAEQDIAQRSAGSTNYADPMPYDEFGLFSMSGAAPIWNKVVNPIASGLTTAVDGLANFKIEALNQLEIEGQIAIRAGDDAALRSAAIRHTFVDLMLPGSPQELALGVVGGVVIGKAVGMVGGVLSRAAAESTSFRFLTADIGDFASTEATRALINMANVFRPTRLASDMSFEQTQSLRGLSTAAYEQLNLAGNSPKALGPAFTVAQDMVTGEVRFGLNNKLGRPPNNLVDVLDSRLLNMPPEIQAGYIRSAGAGSHAEIYAVNDLLQARPGAQLNEIAVHTIETGTPAWARGQYKPACPHCNFILNGVHYVNP